MIYFLLVTKGLAVVHVLSCAVLNSVLHCHWSLTLAICKTPPQMLAVDFHHEEGCPYILVFSPNLDLELELLFFF